MSTAKLFLAAMAMAAVFFVGVNARVAAHYNNHEVSFHSFFVMKKFHSIMPGRYKTTLSSQQPIHELRNYASFELWVRATNERVEENNKKCEKHRQKITILNFQ